jgi:hypothetical protein
MTDDPIKIPEVPEVEQTPLVQTLLGIIGQMGGKIEKLEQEILKLKGETVKPQIKPSKMDDQAGTGDEDGEKKRPDKPGPKRRKTEQMEIDHTQQIELDEVPAGSTFKGYQDYVVQDLVIERRNTRYRLAQWLTPDGKYITAKAPASLGGGHFGPALVSYILYQYHHQHVTQPLLWEHLIDLGVDISSGQLNRLVTEGKDRFHQEKDEILSAGIEVSRYLHTDDTTARHGGKNGYCTHIGNELFAWFSSTESKSRVNFLGLLRADHKDYVVNVGALEYMTGQGLAQKPLALLEAHEGAFATKEAWLKHLEELGIKGKRHIAIATEGALMGSLLAHGFPVDMSIVSDDAGQFNVFDHALCWIHAERGINRLIPLSDAHHKAVDWARGQIWDLYADLKAYKTAPSEELKVELSARFDEICVARTCFETLNQALKRIGRNKDELLLVLEKPWLPLHNNLSERDIRDYAKKRKISGSTRSEEGRRCRDTFASLKKTCRKHKISFWNYLKDRVARLGEIPPLPEVIRQAAQAAAA